MSTSENSSDYTDVTSDESDYEESEELVEERDSEDSESVEDSDSEDSESVEDSDSEKSELEKSETEDSVSDDSESTDIESEESESTDSESEENESEDSDSEKSELEESELEESVSVDSESVDSESVDSESEESESEESESVDSESEESESEESDEVIEKFDPEDFKSSKAELGEDSDPLEDEITVVHEPVVKDNFVSTVGSILGEVLLHFKVVGEVITIKSPTECVYKFGDHTLRVTGEEIIIDGKVSWTHEIFCFEVLRHYLNDFYCSKEDTLSEYAEDKSDLQVQEPFDYQNRGMSFNQPTPPILHTPDNNSWYSEESFKSEVESEHEAFIPGDEENEVSVVVDLCRRVSKQDEYIRLLKLKHENLYQAYRKLASQHQEHKLVTGDRILQLQGMMRDHAEELDDVNRKIGYLERSLEDKYRDLSDRFTAMNQSVLDYSDKYRHLVENTPTHSTVRHQLASITEEVIKKVLVEKLNPIIEVAAKESAAACIKDFSSNVFNGIMTSTRERITKIERMLKTFGNIADLHM